MLVKKHRILLVEDDKNLGLVTKDYLETEGFEVDLIEDGKKGLESADKRNYDLLLLDVMLPKTDGFTISKTMRDRGNDTPIIFLTAKNMQEDKIKGLRLGADDYITKPFSPEELILRIEAILRRTASLNSHAEAKPKQAYQIGSYVFDYVNQRLTHPEEDRVLTRKEADLLNVLCRNMNNLVKREDALKSIWGENDYFMGRSMDVYIAKLRKFLKSDPSVSITNVHNSGFKLEVV
ncbi:MAG: response regulator transcription factor [Bacteroidales bacterium]|nr:response regulator transcription factor [Bacteroidales bacterium]